VLVFATEAGAVSRLLRAPALLWLGERSYSIYSQLWQNDVVSLLYMVVGAAAVTCRVIEVPARSWFRRLARPRARQDARIAMQTAPRHAVID
jgi:peptidoglycan/LPS O-acetylase OafA/YrhL